MSNRSMSRKSQRKPVPGVRAESPATAMPRWRWSFYVAIGTLVLIIIFLKVSAGLAVGYPIRDTWLQTSAWGALCVSGVFTGLIMALLKLLLDPVFLGIAQRKSKLVLAEELVTSVAETAAGVAAEGVLGAVAGSARGSEPDGFSGDGGSFGGGGASGKY